MLTDNETKLVSDLSERLTTVVNEFVGEHESNECGLVEVARLQVCVQLAMAGTGEYVKARRNVIRESLTLLRMASSKYMRMRIDNVAHMLEAA